MVEAKDFTHTVPVLGMRHSSSLHMCRVVKCVPYIHRSFPEAFQTHYAICQGGTGQPGTISFILHRELHLESEDLGEVM